MESLNKAFYFVTDKIIELQGFFQGVARGIAYVVLLIAICMAAVNYALTGTGLKENVVKITKAVVFYAVVMFIYPNIVGWMTGYSFSLARDSTFSSMQGFFTSTTETITDHAFGDSSSYADTVLKEREDFFSGIINTRTFTTDDGKTFSYSTVAPAAALKSMMLVAGECLNFVDKSSTKGLIGDIGAMLKGLFCALLIMFAGIFAVLEYLIAFIEFMFVSSVGIILFPLSLWEGTKFMAEKFIGAMLGFFVKLLFCSICIFLMLYGYLALARMFTENAFTGLVEEMVIIAFTSILFLYISKSAPALAQSLLTGTPSLSAAGAIGTVASAVGAAASIGGLGANLAGAGARGLLSGSSTLAKAAGTAGGAVKALNDPQASTAQKAWTGGAAFVGSIANSAREAIGDKGSNLSRSLLSRPLFGREQYPGAPGVNPRSATQQLLRSNDDGSRRSYRQFYGERLTEGKKQGTMWMSDKYMSDLAANQAAKRPEEAPSSKNPS